MLEYDRIDLSEGIDIKKCIETSTECSLCKFYYFLDKNFNYGPYLCNGCHEWLLRTLLETTKYLSLDPSISSI